MAVRKALRSFHKWFGLTAALWLLLVSGSGIIVLFHDEIDRSLNPDLFVVKRSNQYASLGALSETIAMRYPGNFASFLELARQPGDSTRIYLSPEPGSANPVAAGTHVFVNPHNGEILGERVLGAVALDRKHFPQLVYEFHMTFLAGPWISGLLSLLGLAWMINLLIGIFLAIPRMKHWRASFKIRLKSKFSVLLYDLHRTVGLVAVVAMLAIAVTGIYLQWSQSQAFIAAITQVTPDPGAELPDLKTPLLAPPVSLDRAVSIARTATNNATVDTISLLPDKGVYAIQFHDPRDAGEKGGRSVLVDMQNGTLLMNRHNRDGGWGDEFIAWQHPLHSGQAFGRIGRMFNLVAGLCVVLLTVTGTLMWRRRAMSRKSAPSRS